MAKMLPSGISPTGSGPEQRSAVSSPVAAPDNRALPVSPLVTSPTDSRGGVLPVVSDVPALVRRDVPGDDLSQSLTSTLSEPGTPVVGSTPSPGRTRSVSELVLPQAASAGGDEPKADATDPEGVERDGAREPRQQPGEQPSELEVTGGRRDRPPPPDDPPGGSAAQAEEPEESNTDFLRRMAKELRDSLAGIDELDVESDAEDPMDALEAEERDRNALRKNVLDRANAEMRDWLARREVQEDQELADMADGFVPVDAPRQEEEASPARELSPRERDLARQEEEFPLVLGLIYDGVHRPGGIEIGEGKIIYYGQSVDLDSLDQTVAEQREAFLATSERVIAATQELSPDLDRVFSPFNGGETLGLSSEYTLATDRLPIGTPEQVDALYNNEFARGMYLLDKLDRGHSYSGVTNALAYTGAMLQWDITAIQGGEIQEVAYLDREGQNMTNRQESASGVRITYTTPDNRTRIHEQYTGTFETLPDHVKAQIARGSFDGLYIRGAEGLVLTHELFPEYRKYVEAVRSGGVVVSDSREEDLTRRMEGVFEQKVEVPLEDNEQFGYAGRNAKIDPTTAGSARQGHVNILQKVS